MAATIDEEYKYSEGWSAEKALQSAFSETRMLIRCFCARGTACCEAHHLQRTTALVMRYPSWLEEQVCGLRAFLHRSSSHSISAIKKRRGVFSPYIGADWPWPAARLQVTPARSAVMTAQLSAANAQC